MQLLRFALSLFLALAAASATPSETFTIAFGSCLKQDKPQPIWDAVHALRPDVFLFTGDSFYADTRKPTELTRHYRNFATNPDIERLRGNSRIFAVWDDHDYGENDAGADYPLKTLAHRLFRETFQLDPDSRAWHGPGIYDAHAIHWRGLHIQIILLDTRSFRTPLQRQGMFGLCPYPPDAPQGDPRATMLGPAQWAWLERQLQEPADLRLLVSSTQVLPDRHCREKWANFPHERRRLLELIREQNAENLIILSGDRHFADLSRLPANEIGYPLYEITASGLNSAGWRIVENNRLRVGKKRFSEDNFGLIRLKEAGEDADIFIEIRDVTGKTVISHKLQGSDLRRSKPLSR